MARLTVDLKPEQVRRIVRELDAALEPGDAQETGTHGLMALPERTIKQRPHGKVACGYRLIGG
jgi:hypothetical protein